MDKKGLRIDQLMVIQNLVPSRTRAQSLIMAGKVLVENHKVLKPSEKYFEERVITLLGNDCPYVSRGGLKMARALTAFNIDVKSMEFLDAGSSTGGFTDCLLQHNASGVWCVDVGYGQLDWKLRSDSRVRIYERTNIKNTTLDLLKREQPFDGAVADLSFIGLSTIAHYIVNLVADNGILVFLVKPQFEAGKSAVEKGGVVKNLKSITASATKVCDTLNDLGVSVNGLIPSAVKTPKGNKELLLYGIKDNKSRNLADMVKLEQELRK